tara:strand:- start:341 stop:535 length:195 start_codon:yes stop_codon:yes gene_type:complete
MALRKGLGETRIAVGKNTRDVLKQQKVADEAFDTLFRRMLLSGTPRRLEEFTAREQEWILNRPL